MNMDFELIKKEYFCNQDTDISGDTVANPEWNLVQDRWGDCDYAVFKDKHNRIFALSAQLGAMLGYANPVDNVNTLVRRTPTLASPEYSWTFKLNVHDKPRKYRVFTEKGIYRAAMASGMPKAEAICDLMASLAEKLRRGEIITTDRYNRDYESVTLDRYLGFDEDDRAIAFFDARKRNKELLTRCSSVLRQKEILERENLILSPKAQFYDNHLNTDGLISFSLALKELEISITELKLWLYRLGVADKRTNERQSFGYPVIQDSMIKKDLFTYRLSKVQDGNSTIASAIPYFTRKGFTWFIEAKANWEKHNPGEENILGIMSK
jgi:phage antirepressor YoqD-like protein